MNYQALTLKAPGIVRSIMIPVVVSQSKILYQKFKLEKKEADVLANVYLIDVLLRSMVAFTHIRSTEFVRNDIFDVIIGMDILTQGDLAITNHDHRTVVSFRVPPDTKHIDYVAAANDNFG